MRYSRRRVRINTSPFLRYHFLIQGKRSFAKTGLGTHIRQIGQKKIKHKLTWHFSYCAGSAQRGWLAGACRSHFITINAFWTAPVVIYHMKLLLDLLMLLNLTAVASWAYTYSSESDHALLALEEEEAAAAAAAAEPHTVQTGERASSTEYVLYYSEQTTFSMNERLLYAGALGVAVSEILQLRHRLQLLPMLSQASNDVARLGPVWMQPQQLRQLWSSHVDTWRSLDWVVLLCLFASFCFQWRLYSALQYSGGELVDTDAATAASRCLLIAAVLSAVRFTGMMLFSESVGMASVAAAFHAVIFASVRVVLALALALLLVVTNVFPYTPAITAADAAAGEHYSDDDDDVMGTARLGSGHMGLILSDAALTGCFAALALVVLDRCTTHMTADSASAGASTARDVALRCRAATVDYSAAIRHAGEVAPLSLLFVGCYQLPLALLRALDYAAAKAVCSTVEGGLIGATLRLGGESLIDLTMGEHRRMLHTQPAAPAAGSGARYRDDAGRRGRGRRRLRGSAIKARVVGGVATLGGGQRLLPRFEGGVHAAAAAADDGYGEAADGRSIGGGGDAMILQPQLKCHARLRARQRQQQHLNLKEL